MNPASLDSLSTGWLRRRRGVLAALPGLTHETGSVQVEADLCAIKHPVFPPYSGSGETTAQATVGKRLLCQLAPWIETRWSAYRIERRCRWDDWEFRSETTLLPCQSGCVVRWTIRNGDERRRKIDFGLLLSGRGRDTGPEGYAWSVPEVPTDVFQMRARKGLAVNVTAGDAPGARLFESRDEPAFSQQSVQPAENDNSATIEHARWQIDLEPGGEWEGSLLSTYGDSTAAVRQLSKEWNGRAEAAFRASREWWEALWQAAFTPGSTHFSGHMPILKTDNDCVSRLYYMGILTLLCLRRRYEGSRLETAYLTLGPRRGEGSIYLAWDLPYTAQVMARLDPDALEAHWQLLNSAPLFGHMVVNLFKGEHTAFPCVGDPLARITPVTELARHRDISQLLSKEIERNGPPIERFERDGTEVHGADRMEKLSGESAFLEAATAHRQFPLPGSALVNYGDRGSYLECCTTYAHGTAGHTAVQYRAVLDAQRLGKTGFQALPDELRKLRDAIIDLYRPGEGYFDCLHSDRLRHPTGNLYDLGLVLTSMGSDLPREMIHEISAFVEAELATPTWARCLRATDPDSASGLRCDHQWAGCFAAWPGQFILGLARADFRPEWVANWVEGLAKVTAQGPFAQAYFAEDVVEPELGAAAKAFDEFPQGNHWMISSGAYYAHVVLEALLEWNETDGSIHPWPGLSGTFELFDPAKISKNSLFEG